MSAKTKTTKPASHYYHYQLPDGTHLGRRGMEPKLSPQGDPTRAVPFTTRGILQTRAAILTTWPEAKIVPATSWNDTNTPIPNLN